MLVFRSYVYSVARDCDNGKVNSKVGQAFGNWNSFLACSFDFFG